MSGPSQMIGDGGTAACTARAESNATRDAWKYNAMSAPRSIVELYVGGSATCTVAKE